MLSNPYRRELFHTVHEGDTVYEGDRPSFQERVDPSHLPRFAIVVEQSTANCKL
jgi:hypothetical protein